VRQRAKSLKLFDDRDFHHLPLLRKKGQSLLWEAPPLELALSPTMAAFGPL
jgi:hypothetical protein